jgi:thymidine phosphorylase
VAATTAGYLQSLDALLVGRTAVALGAGRDKKSDPVDLSAGIILHRKPGESVAPGDPVMELRYNDEARLANALSLAQQAFVIDARPPVEEAQMIGWVHDGGEQMFAALTDGPTA